MTQKIQITTGSNISNTVSCSSMDTVLTTGLDKLVGYMTYDGYSYSKRKATSKVISLEELSKRHK